MKYILIAMLLVSCTSPAPSGGEYTVNNNTQPTYDYRVVMIDGCQYIEVDVGVGSNSRYTLTHKGNCNNIIHPEHLRQ